MNKILQKLNGLFISIINWSIVLFNFCDAPVKLIVRFYLAKLFFFSGLTKVTNWENTIFLFKHEYKINYISPEIAALFGTAAEFIFPAMLIVGLGTRFAAFGIVLMTAMIEFSYMHHNNHYYWLMLAGMLVTTSSGKWSVDHYIANKNGGSKAKR